MRLLLAAILLFSVTLVTAQNIDDDPEVVSLYARGKRLLREQSYLNASKVFEELAGRFSNSDNLDLFIFHRAKADYYFGSYNEAIAGFNYFIKRFSKSTEKAYAHFFLGNSYYYKSDLTLALRHYFQAYSTTTDNQLTDLSKASIEQLINGATSVTLSKADFDEVSQARRCSLIKFVAQSLIDNGMSGSARQVAAYCPDDLGLDGKSGKASHKNKNTIEIAMVLPLSGEMQSFGEEIINGAAVGAILAQQESGFEFKLTPYDTRGIPIDAARIILELAGSNSDLAVGPLTSEEAQVVSAALSCSDLPLLIPAATQAGLTTLAPGAFQLSPNIELQGIIMADYAINQLGADTAAIITSTRTDHLQMALAFSERFSKLGGTVLSIEYYRSRDKDFGPLIRDIKASLIGAEPDSTFFINDNGDTLKFDGISAYLDCLFMPGTATQLRLLLAQLNFYNLYGAYLGTDGWGDKAVYKLGDEITKGAVFPSPFLSQGAGVDYLKFSALFDTRYGRQPQRLANLGYDAIRLAALTLADGGKNRESFVDRLQKTNKYMGASGIVTFGEYRENVEMPLYKIENESAVLFDRSASNANESEPDSDGEAVEN